jgi:hypothetical protein
VATADEWRPVETAPKDGTKILVSILGKNCVGHDERSYDVVSWEGGLEWCNGDTAVKVRGITHWQPIEPPK